MSHETKVPRRVQRIAATGIKIGKPLIEACRGEGDQRVGLHQTFGGGRSVIGDAGTENQGEKGNGVILAFREAHTGQISNRRIEVVGILGTVLGRYIAMLGISESTNIPLEENATDRTNFNSSARHVELCLLHVQHGCRW